jgi:hypothetical protein
MNARAVFFAHLGFNGLVLMAALGGFYLAAAVGGNVARGAAAMAVAELIGFALVWQAWHGCPFTQLEKRLLAEEGRRTYEGPCLAHYAREWLGVSLTERGADVVSVCVILLPAAGAVLSLW